MSVIFKSEFSRQVLTLNVLLKPSVVYLSYVASALNVFSILEVHKSI